MQLSDKEISEVIHELTRLTKELQSLKIKIEAIREKILHSIEDK